MTVTENGGTRRARFGVAEWVGIATLVTVGGSVILSNTIVNGQQDSSIERHDEMIDALVKSADAERDKTSSQRDTLTELNTLIRVTQSTSEVRRQQLTALTESLNSMIADQRVMRRDLSQLKEDMKDLRNER